jgi:hypothetical protein
VPIPPGIILMTQPRRSVSLTEASPTISGLRADQQLGPKVLLDTGTFVSHNVTLYLGHHAGDPGAGALVA